jgi:hypothetical protein
MMSRRATIVRIAVLAMVGSFTLCFYSLHITNEVAKKPWGYRPNPFELACYWSLAPGILLVTSVLPHYPLDSPEDQRVRPIPHIKPIVAGSSAIMWAILILVIYLAVYSISPKRHATQLI